MTDPYHDFLCAAFRNDRGEVRAALRRDTWDWEALIRTASREALLPAMHAQFKSLDLLPELPAEVASFLQAVETVNRERNQAIVTELKAAVAQLNRIGIEPVLLKGLAYLTTGVYQDPAHRFLTDIDILVPEEQREAAAETLAQNGWRADELDPFRNYRHHAPPLRRPSSVWIEIHHSLGEAGCDRLLPGQEVIGRSLAVDLDGLQVRVPSAQDLLAHLILHSQIQHPYDGRIWTPIRAMLDLLLLNRRFASELTWESVASRFSAARKYGVFALFLLQVEDSLGVTIPLPIRLNPFLRFCRYRRKALRGYPKLRYADPFYMFSIALARRLWMFRKVLATKNGHRYLLAQILEPGNYLRIWADLVAGRGR